MRQNLILDALPTSVMVNGVEYPINSDFRTSMLFELTMQDGALSDREKVITALGLYYPEMPDDPLEALKQAIWFYKGGDDEKTAVRGNQQSEESEPAEQSQAYSFEYDDAYFVAAFWQQYHINLTEEDLHWWTFRALFRGLTEDCQLVKIMGYRTTRITDKLSKSEKEHLRKMKKLYALPLSQAEQEYQDKLTEALLHGGDLRGLLGDG